MTIIRILTNDETLRCLILMCKKIDTFTSYELLAIYKSKKKYNPKYNYRNVWYHLYSNSYPKSICRYFNHLFICLNPLRQKRYFFSFETWWVNQPAKANHTTVYVKEYKIKISEFTHPSIFSFCPCNVINLSVRYLSRDRFRIFVGKVFVKYKILLWNIYYMLTVSNKSREDVILISKVLMAFWIFFISIC